MKSTHPDTTQKALVTVFDNLETAKIVIDDLHREGFPLGKLELVTNNVKLESPEIGMPELHQTTASSAAAGAVKGAGIGLGIAAGFGVAATVLTASPGLAIGAMIYAGLTGALFGGVGGVDKADLDDSVNLPTPDEYQRLVDEGNNLVVVCGTHQELARAEVVLKNMPHAGSHMHRLHGHLFHEHPSHLPAESHNTPLGNSEISD